MAGVRDPAFWKRFSLAVHMDEEQQQGEKKFGAHHKDQYVDLPYLRHLILDYFADPFTETRGLHVNKAKRSTALRSAGASGSSSSRSLPPSWE